MGSKKSRKVISVEMKQEIIRKSECGVKLCELVKEFGLNKTTIFTILTNKDALKSANVAKGVTRLFSEKHRSSIHDELEKLLAIWIKDRQRKGDVTTKKIICHKAKIIYNDLKKNVAGRSSSQDNEGEFKASKGWFMRFKKRSGFNTVSMHNEAGSTDKQEAEKFSINVQNCIKEELIEEHDKDLTTEELQALLVLQQDNVKKEASSDNEDQQSNNQPIPIADIKNILVKWKAVQKFTNAHYPDSAEANRINDLYSDTLVRYFRQMLKKRKKQVTSDRFFMEPSVKKQEMDVEDVQESVEFT